MVTHLVWELVEMSQPEGLVKMEDWSTNAAVVRGRKRVPQS